MYNEPEKDKDKKSGLLRSVFLIVIMAICVFLLFLLMPTSATAVLIRLSGATHIRTRRRDPEDYQNLIDFFDDLRDDLGINALYNALYNDFFGILIPLLVLLLMLSMFPVFKASIDYYITIAATLLLCAIFFPDKFSGVWMVIAAAIPPIYEATHQTINWGFLTDLGTSIPSMYLYIALGILMLVRIIQNSPDNVLYVSGYYNEESINNLRKIPSWDTDDEIIGYYGPHCQEDNYDNIYLFTQDELLLIDGKKINKICFEDIHEVKLKDSTISIMLKGDRKQEEISMYGDYTIDGIKVKGAEAFYQSLLNAINY